MDKKKKIIVSAVFGLFMIGIVWFVVSTMMSSDNPVVKKGFEVTTPEVDEEKLDSLSKIESYEQELGFGNIKTKEIIDEEEGKSANWKDNLVELDIFGRKDKEEEETTSDDVSAGVAMSQEVNPELLALIQAQEEMMAQQQQALAQQRQQQSKSRQQAGYPQDDPFEQADPIEEPPLTVGKIREQHGSYTDYFQGAGGFSPKSNTLELIPAEFVDQGYLILNSTVAIRTKQTLRINNPRLVIPKGAILYGKASFGGLDRLSIDIESYKYGNKLNPVELVVYDFDGREGVHLGNLPWPKIPSKVSKEVFDYIKQRGSQAGQFGGAAEIDLGQAKDIAILSALKEITEELFDRRRVFMPRKYNIWINVPKDDDL